MLFVILNYSFFSYKQVCLLAHLFFDTHYFAHHSPFTIPFDFLHSSFNLISPRLNYGLISISFVPIKFIYRCLLCIEIAASNFLDRHGFAV